MSLQRPPILSQRLISTVFAITLLLAPFTAADSPVWKISKDDKHLYLGGTMHLLSASDYPLPRAFNHAYQAAHSLVLETDLNILQSPEFGAKMLQAMTFNDDRTLKSSIKPATFNALKKYFKQRGLPFSNFARYTPAGITLIITMVEMQAMGMDPNLGVDQHFARQANNDGKALGQLETPDEQLSFIASMGQGQEDELIIKTLAEVETIPAVLNKMKAAWRSGDTEALNKLGAEEMKREYPEIYKTLLFNRNHAWLPKIERMLNDKDIELILVGALHLSGEDGLISLLKEKGYQIQNVQNTPIKTNASL